MDLVVRNGRLIDPARKIDTVGNIVIRGGKIQSIGVVDASDLPIRGGGAMARRDHRHMTTVRPWIPMRTPQLDSVQG